MSATCYVKYLKNWWRTHTRCFNFISLYSNLIHSDIISAYSPFICLFVLFLILLMFCLYFHIARTCCAIDLINYGIFDGTWTNNAHYSNANDDNILDDRNHWNGINTTGPSNRIHFSTNENFDFDSSCSERWLVRFWQCSRMHIWCDNAKRIPI